MHNKVKMVGNRLIESPINDKGEGITKDADSNPTSFDSRIGVVKYFLNGHFTFKNSDFMICSLDCRSCLSRYPVLIDRFLIKKGRSSINFSPND